MFSVHEIPLSSSSSTFSGCVDVVTKLRPLKEKDFPIVLIAQRKEEMCRSSRRRGRWAVPLIQPKGKKYQKIKLKKQVQHESVITTKWEQTIKGQNNPLKKIIIKPFLFQPVFFILFYYVSLFLKKKKIE
jgi:hypothetical protein